MVLKQESEDSGPRAEAGEKEALRLRVEAIDHDRFGADAVIGKLEVPLAALPVQQSFSPVTADEC